MATHKLTFSWQRSSEVLSKAVNKTADGDISLDAELPYNSVAQEVAIALTPSKLVSIFMYGTRNVLVMTNSASVPGNSFQLLIDEPFVWTNNGYITNPFTTTVTTMFARNTSGATASLFMRLLTDLTVP